MFPFKKKKLEEELPEDELPVKKTRKRKKKELPPKPWGRLERIIVFIFLISAPILSLTFLMHSKNSKTAKPIPDNTQVLSDTISVNSGHNANELKQELGDETNGLTGTYGIWIQALDNSYKLGINENDEFNSVSFAKISLLTKYKVEVSKGNIDGNSLYTIKYIEPDLGTPGEKISYDDIAGNLEKNFDNSAFSALSGILGEVTDSTTPSNFGLLIYNNLGIVRNIDTKNFITEDAEIVTTAKPYILIIMMKDGDPDEAKTEIPKIRDIVAQSLGK